MGVAYFQCERLQMRFREPFPFQYLCYIPSIHKHIGDGAAVDILAVGHDADRPFFEELLKALPGFWSVWFVQFRGVDAAESDTFRSHAQSIAVVGVDGLAGGDSSPGDPA